MNFPLGIYFVLFLGLLFGGETILVPIVYYTIFGSENLNIWIVMIVAIIATIISDSFWYALGRSIKFKNFLSKQLKAERFIQKPLAVAENFLNSYNLKLLFISKFVYGTRIVMQIVSGLQKVPFWTYQIVNSSAVLVWFFFILTLAYISGEGFSKFGEGNLAIYIGFVIFILLTLIALFVMKKILGNKI